MSLARYAEVALRGRKNGKPGVSPPATPKATTGPQIDREALHQMARDAVEAYEAGPRKVAVKLRPPRRSLDDPDARAILALPMARSYPAAAERLAQEPNLTAASAAEILLTIRASDPNHSTAVRGM